MISVDLDKAKGRAEYNRLPEGIVIHVHIRGEECIAVTRKCSSIACKECFLYARNFPSIPGGYPCLNLGSLGVVPIEDTVE